MLLYKYLNKQEKNKKNVAELSNMFETLWNLVAMGENWSEVNMTHQ